MSTLRGAKTLLERFPQLRKGIELVQRDVLGHLPKTGENLRTGYNRSVKQFKGVYLNQYYMEPIDKSVKKVFPGFTFPLEERRAEKLRRLRKRGKGPPKKGSGKKKK